MPKQNFFSNPSAFTLLEILIATALIGILAGIAIPLYNKSKEHGLGEEAVINLKLIYAAERSYGMDNGNYTACACSSDTECNGAGGCNTLLKLNLKTENWTYSGLNSGMWQATANRQGAGGYLDCTYRVLLGNDLSSTNPQAVAGTCP